MWVSIARYSTLHGDLLKVYIIGIAGGGSNSEDDKFVQAEVMKFMEEKF
jgi:hypothetical protein